jgi:hypothetical protein
MALVGVLVSIVALVNHYKNKIRENVFKPPIALKRGISKKLHDELAVFLCNDFAETQDLQNPEKETLQIT